MFVFQVNTEIRGNCQKSRSGARLHRVIIASSIGTTNFLYFAIASSNEDRSIAATPGGGPGGGIMLGGPTVGLVGSLGQANGCCIGMFRPGGGAIGGIHTGWSFTITPHGFTSVDDPGREAASAIGKGCEAAGLVR